MVADQHQHQAPILSERIGMEPNTSRHDRVTEWMAGSGWMRWSQVAPTW